MICLPDRWCFRTGSCPPIFKKRTTYYWREMKKRPDFFLDVKQDKIWYRSKNLIYNLQRFDAKSKTIHGMAVYTFDDEFNLVQVVDAERAEFTPTGWKLLNGTVTVFSQDDPFPLTQQFKEKELLIAETPKDFQEIEKEVDGLRLKELYRYIQRMKAAGADTKSYEVKFHSRISLSFIPIVMCVLGRSLFGARAGAKAEWPRTWASAWSSRFSIGFSIRSDYPWGPMVRCRPGSPHGFRARSSQLWRQRSLLASR